MVEIKVCGIRRKEDIDYVNVLKPDYMGFIFAESKRQITKETAKHLKDRLDKNIKTVGIFVNEDIDNLIKITDFVDLDIVQLHGDEDFNYIESLRKRIDKDIWKAIRVKNKDSLSEIQKLDVDGILLDTYSKEAYGGLGETFDWNIAKNLKLDKKIILAGGISVENLEQGIIKLNPDIIDVSSGVETDGFKDFDKMKNFINKGRKL